MSVNWATRSQTLASMIIMPLVLSGCLMNDPVEPDQNSFTPPEITNDAPVISGTPPQMIKVGVNYSFTPTASDPDADPISFTVSNQPNWTDFDNETGELSGMPTLGSEGTYNDIMIMVSDGQVTSDLPAFSISVEPAAAANMPPVISGNAPDTIVVDSEYSFQPTATDPDGDELSFSVTNKPDWASFNQTNGRLFGTPLAGDEGDYNNVSITVSDGQMDASLPAFDITVNAGNSAPTIDGSAPATVTVGGTYSFRPNAADVDGDELDFDIANKPEWATFNRANGRIFGVPENGDEGTYANVMIEVTDGQAKAMLPEFSITVESAPVNNARPTISGSPAITVTSGNMYSFTPTAMDADNDTLTFSINNKPSWANFNTGTGRLSGTPASSDAGDYTDIIISVSDGALSASLSPFSVNVVSANRAPTISGTAASAVTAGQAYAFTPNATDPDNDTLTFSIQGKPSWANFNTTNGRLSGTPDAGDVATYNNIRITVSDGDLTDTLSPFSVDVVAVNRAPTISGTAATAVTAGQAYAFTPNASDPDNDTLTFSIQGKPSWANFNTSNGRLSGTPDAGDVATYNNIRIAVSDGDLTDELNAFSITVNQPASSTGSVTLSWTPPTQNTDGSQLNDLWGYRIYYGTSPGSYPNTIRLDDSAGLSSYVVEDLAPGTYYFVSTAVNDSMVESDRSNMAQKTVSPP